MKKKRGKRKKKRNKEFEPKAQDVMPGSADLCFLTDENVEKVLEVFQEPRFFLQPWRLPESVEISLLSAPFAPFARGKKKKESPYTGAVGKIRSVYVRDPDGNLIE
jgi:catechol 2,3-dioxygenase-like lactoylglutathione lyase family enzyme